MAAAAAAASSRDEISRRQKEILVATWNLIKERDEKTSSYLDEQQLNDNAQMLADLQRTLADQARTLASRARARQLTGVDPRIQTFVDNLEQAADAMGRRPSSSADIALDRPCRPSRRRCSTCCAPRPCSPTSRSRSSRAAVAAAAGAPAAT